MRCKHCNNRLANHDIWCVECGKQTEVIKNELSALKSLGNTYKSWNRDKASAVPGTAFALIAGLIPILVLIVLFHRYISLESNTAMRTILNLGIKSISISIFVPFILIAFSSISSHDQYHLSLSDMLKGMRSYPRYLGFTLISAFYFSLIHLICFGLPNFGSLPILRLVWLVLVNYWIAIALPAAVLMESLDLCPGKAIKMSYRHFHDVRWNIYLLGLVLAILNLVAGALLFFPLVFSLPLSLFAIRDYTKRLVDFELLEYRR